MQPSCVEKQHRSYSEEKFYISESSDDMFKQKWELSIQRAKRNDRASSFTVQNKQDFNQGAISRDPSANGPNSLQQQKVESRLRQRWRTGNILIIMVPLGAAFLPALFLLSAFIHAKDLDLLRLKNQTNVPYISDVGNYKPHSSVFTFGLTLSALFGLWLIILRYLQVEHLYHNTGSKANLCSFATGLLSILGELMVASFQLSSHSTMHYVGAFLHFASIMVFMGLQTFITHRNIENEGRRNCAVLLVILRGLLSSGLLLCLVVFGVFLLPSLSQYNRKGYSVAQGAEWAMLGCSVLFMLSFLYEFKDLACSVAVDYLENRAAVYNDADVATNQATVGLRM